MEGEGSWDKLGEALTCKHPLYKSTQVAALDGLMTSERDSIGQLGTMLLSVTYAVQRCSAGMAVQACIWARWEWKAGEEDGAGRRRVGSVVLSTAF